MSLLVVFYTNRRETMDTVILTDGWELVRESSGEAYPARLPCDTFSCLLENGVIPDPYSERNELEVQWVGRENWIFRTSFSIEKNFLNGRFVFLFLDFADTFADVVLNDVSIGRTGNMFRRYRFRADEYLAEGRNTIEIRFESSEKEALERLNRLPYPIPHTVYPVQAMGRNLIRKAQCHAGWDWGPCLMVSGIYEDLRLISTPCEFIEYVHTDFTKNGNQWDLAVSIELYTECGGTIGINAECAGSGASMSIELRPGLQTAVAHLTVDNPELWWPAGFGDQTRYELKVKTDHDEYIRKVGFRTIEVLTEEDDHGRGMVFRVNGKDIFCKGSNWIPMDAMPGRYSSSRYEELLQSAVDANMNMLRVWGGGHYEHDYFYETCDRLGIMIWQDFMFSCALYPSDSEFLEEVREEVSFQVKRLKDHPCIALWCGNNEDVGALTWFEESRINRDRYIIDYDRLNEGVIGRTVKALDPNRRWWPSSPSAGENDFSDCWHDDTKGDMHYWSVWHEGKPFESYYDVTPRFCSEFGFQSLPSAALARSFSPHEQLNITSPVMEHHQKNEMGNAIIIASISRYFRFPSGFEETIYLSQIQQAMAIQTAVEYWRSRRPVCMGSLYWQFNDNWPVASWSSIEYGGRWKPLLYSARRFYAPQHLCIIHRPEGRVSFYGLNDGFTDLRGTLTVQLFGFDGRLLEEKVVPGTIAAESASLLYEIDAGMDWPAAEYGLENCFYYGSFESESGEIALENSKLLMVPKKCSIQPADIGIRTHIEAGKLALELTTDTPAFYTVVDVPGFHVRFSDNNFTLLPGNGKRIELIEDGGMDLSTLADKVVVHSLRNYRTNC